MASHLLGVLELSHWLKYSATIEKSRSLEEDLVQSLTLSPTPENE
jgi:hypothetical protein